MEKIPVTGLISPVYSSDNYPVIDPRFGIDGLRSLDTLTDMYSVPLEKRRAGMVVGIPNTSSNTVAYYKLKPEGNGVTWSVGQASDWDGFLTSATGSNAVPVKYLVTNETITVPTNYEYLIWGNMTVGASGSFVNDGRTYVINGTIATASDGATSGGGQYNFITVPTKYTETFQCGPAGVIVTHGLGTQDITYSVRDSNNFVTVNMEIINSNSVTFTSGYTFSAKITIIG
jgi:hypothetical protein